MTASFSVLPKSWPEYSYFTFYANFTALHVTHSIGWRRGHENFKDTLKKWTFKFHQILKCESTELLSSSMPNILLSSPFISGISMSLSKDYRQIVCKISWERKQNTNASEKWKLPNCSNWANNKETYLKYRYMVYKIIYPVFKILISLWKHLLIFSWKLRHF